VVLKGTDITKDLAKKDYKIIWKKNETGTEIEDGSDIVKTYLRKKETYLATVFLLNNDNTQVANKLFTISLLGPNVEDKVDFTAEKTLFDKTVDIKVKVKSGDNEITDKLGVYSLKWSKQSVNVTTNEEKKEEIKLDENYTDDGSDTYKSYPREKIDYKVKVELYKDTTTSIKSEEIIIDKIGSDKEDEDKDDEDKDKEDEEEDKDEKKGNNSNPALQQSINAPILPSAPKMFLRGRDTHRGRWGM